MEFEISVLGRLSRDESEEYSPRQAMMEFSIQDFGGNLLHVLLVL